MLASGDSLERVPDRYKKAKYSDVPADIRKRFENIRKSRKGLYIWGDCGTGKTHIVYAIMRHLIETQTFPIRTKLYNSPELLDIIRSFYGKNMDYADDELKRLQDFKGLLIIDDLGAEKPTDWVAETLYKIINVRYEQEIPMIFTSNFSLDQLAERVGDRIVSRIVEMCDVIELKGEDRRVSG